MIFYVYAGVGAVKKMWAAANLLQRIMSGSDTDVCFAEYALVRPRVRTHEVESAHS